MKYQMKNGETLTLRPPTVEDAAELIKVMRQMDTESPFLARNPGEFSFTIEQEQTLIEAMAQNPDQQWYSAFYQGRLVGQCSAMLVSRGQRFRHRGGVAFALLKEFWGRGIGSCMMEACLAWCREHGVEQVELDVVAENQRARNLYEGFGFEVAGTKPRALKYPDGSYADEIFMIKYL